MKSKKVNLSLVILWGVVAYAIALLTYCTMNNFLNSSADKISAFGSILGAIGTFFAAFVATYLFNDWKAQHNKSIESISYQEALTSFKHISLKVRELKVLHSDCVTFIETEGYVDVIVFLGKYRKIRGELNKNLDIFHSTLLFLQTISEKDEEKANLEKIYSSYIYEAKELLRKPKILEQNFSVPNQESILKEHLYSESEEQSKLLIKNLKMIVDSFQNKILAK